MLLSVKNPLIMGILNVTADSFYAASRATLKDDILHKTAQLIKEGADIIDIGAVSTRPNTTNFTSESEEMDRICAALELLIKEFPKLTISCDTFRAKVADFVIENYNVSIINDISGGAFDASMYEIIAKRQVSYVLMHTRGELSSMHYQYNYSNIVLEICQFFSERVRQLRLLGVNDIIIDPGFGFAKTIDQNFELLKRISYLRNLDCPILVGLSRKSMFYKTFNTSPEDSLNATTVGNMLALQSGASILRVHDVKAAKETIELYSKMR